MRLKEYDNKMNILNSDEGKSLFENKEYEENEIPYYFKEAYLPVSLTIEDCLAKYNEILDSEIIIPTTEQINYDERTPN